MSSENSTTVVSRSVKVFPLKLWILKGWSAEKGGKTDSILAISLVAKQYIINGDVLDIWSRGPAWSHKNGFHTASTSLVSTPYWFLELSQMNMNLLWCKVEIGVTDDKDTEFEFKCLMRGWWCWWTLALLNCNAVIGRIMEARRTNVAPMKAKSGHDKVTSNSRSR